MTSAAQPLVSKETLAEINATAILHMRAGRDLDATITYGKLFQRVRKTNLTHAELYACYNNRAAAHLRLRVYGEALQDSESAKKLAELALKR